MTIALLDDPETRSLKPYLDQAIDALPGGSEEVVWDLSGIDADRVRVVVTARHDLSQDWIDRLMSRFPALEALSLAYTGVDRVDLAYSQEVGLYVTSVPGYASESVAELVVAMALSLLRRLVSGDIQARRGTWDDDIVPGDTLAGKTIGVVGTGDIGIATSRKLRRLGCDILGWSRTERRAFQRLGAYVADLEELLERVDILTLHLPLTTATRKLIDRRMLSHLSHHAILINTSRSALVETSALADALRARTIGGAGIDVFENDPLRGAAIAQSDPLLRLDAHDVNLLVTPHLGFKTREALVRLAARALSNARGSLRHRPAHALVISHGRATRSHAARGRGRRELAARSL